MTTWPASHRGLPALSGRETTRVLKLDQVDPVGVVDGDVADRHAPVCWPSSAPTIGAHP
jgi:hypothetical protein